MAGYGIDDVPHVELNPDKMAALKAADQAQASLMAEAVIQVAEDDTVIGPMSKLETHQGSGHFPRLQGPAGPNRTDGRPAGSGRTSITI